MPVKPKIVTLSNNSADLLNAIRNSASINYQNYVPVATNESDVLRKIGGIICDAPSLQNEFLNSLVNRIGRVILTSKSYQNPIAMFKKGMMEYGETVEEIFVKLIDPKRFDPENAENTVFKREKPDVKAVFHVMNYQTFYKVTTSEDQLRTAFLSASGVTDLVLSIIEQMYTSANYDEFITMKYLLGRAILDGRLPIVYGHTTNTALVKNIKTESNKLEFMNDKHNAMGVKTHTPKGDQYLLVNASTDAAIDVDVMASAFNMSKVEFMGHRVLIDGFGEVDNERLAKLFDTDTTYTAFTSAEIELLNAIDAVLLSKDWFMVFDNLLKLTDIYNTDGLYWNHDYHVWKTFSWSPFAEACVFNQATPSITSVTVAPTAITLGSVGASANLTATVVAANFAPKTVNWSVASADQEYLSVDAAGKVTVLKQPASTGSARSVTVTATSTFDSTKTGTCTVTISKASA